MVCVVCFVCCYVSLCVVGAVRSVPFSDMAVHDLAIVACRCEMKIVLL